MIGMRRGATIAEVAGARYGAQARSVVVAATDDELEDHEALCERVIDEVVIERIEIRDRTALDTTWVRRFPDGKQLEYRCYRVDFGSTAPLLAFEAGDPFNGCLDPDFYVASERSVTIRAANDKHRDELFEALEKQVERRNEQLKEWEQHHFRNIVSSIVRETANERANRRSQRASDEAAGWRSSEARPSSREW